MKLFQKDFVMVKKEKTEQKTESGLFLSMSQAPSNRAKVLKVANEEYEWLEGKVIFYDKFKGRELGDNTVISLEDIIAYEEE